MNKKTIILLALTCGVMYQDAGASEEKQHSSEEHKNHHFLDGHHIKHLHDKIANHHITKHLEKVHKDLENEKKGEASK